MTTVANRNSRRTARSYGSRTSRASRDLTMDHSFRRPEGAAGDIGRARRTGGVLAPPRPTQAPQRPSRENPAGVPRREDPRRSRQQVSRAPFGPRPTARALANRRAVDTSQRSMIAVFSLVALLLLVAGVVGAMVLSGVSTRQSFGIIELQQRANVLAGELDSLNRDMEVARSTGEIARKATDMGLVVPSQPGILEVSANGEVSQVMEPSSHTRPIIDVNRLPAPYPEVAPPTARNVGTPAPGETPRQDATDQGRESGERAERPEQPAAPNAADARGVESRSEEGPNAIPGAAARPSADSPEVFAPPYQSSRNIRSGEDRQ